MPACQPALTRCVICVHLAFSQSHSSPCISAPRHPFQPCWDLIPLQAPLALLAQHEHPKATAQMHLCCSGSPPHRSTFTWSAAAPCRKAGLFAMRLVMQMSEKPPRINAEAKIQRGLISKTAEYLSSTRVSSSIYEYSAHLKNPSILWWIIFSAWKCYFNVISHVNSERQDTYLSSDPKQSFFTSQSQLNIPITYECKPLGNRNITSLHSMQLFHATHQDWQRAVAFSVVTKMVMILWQIQEDPKN